MLHSLAFAVALLAAEPTPADALEAAGKVYPGAKVGQSERHPILDKLAQQQADSMARRNWQDHAGFSARAAEVRKAIDNRLNCAEICAESWPWQLHLDWPALGKEMFWCWKRSPGHWSVAAKRHKYAGYGMARSRQKWFACVLVAD